MTAADAAGDGRQVMIISLFSATCPGLSAKARTCRQKRRGSRSIEIPHDELNAVAQQRAGKLAAGMA